ncbi:MAG: transketolase [Desulfovibrionaceae bacterium]
MQRKTADVLRILAIDAVERAQSGHPGAPMGMADIAEVLWNEFLSHNPMKPQWVNRDRVVLSNGHASMLLYGALHLSGYEAFSMDMLKRFRQFGSHAAGHPEYNLEAGIEMTTGPLGQGLASAVGMAIGEKISATKYNKGNYVLFDHYTYVFVGDGCLMEGISHEACSLAGVLSLSKLIVLYDSNGISIDGNVENWFADDTSKRFESYGWHVIRDVDGHNAEAIREAIEGARLEKDRPSFISFTTKIGFSSPNKENSNAAHGSPLGVEEIIKVREKLQWEYEPFVIPEDIYAHWDAKEKGKRKTDLWQSVFEAYSKQYPELAKEIEERRSCPLSEGCEKKIKAYREKHLDDDSSVATRVASQRIIEEIIPSFPYLIGGSADLTSSVGTWVKDSKHITKKDFSGNYLSYGVREFAMGAIMNGLSLYGGFIPYAGTFLVFSDYAKAAIRLGALMGVQTIWILTHDSIGLGEDGPTHQPIEHLTMLRTIPNLHVFRPSDITETSYAWEYALKNKAGPTAIVLSRQKLPHIKRTMAIAEGIVRGAYSVRDSVDPQVIVLSTGSELHLAVEAHAVLRRDNIHIRVVSVVSTTLFDLQSEEYKKEILLPYIPCIAIEAGEGTSWYKYIGKDGIFIGMNSFGASAPAEELYSHFSITVENIVSSVHRILGL